MNPRFVLFRRSGFGPNYQANNWNRDNNSVGGWFGPNKSSVKSKGGKKEWVAWDSNFNSGKSFEEAA